MKNTHLCFFCIYLFLFFVSGCSSTNGINKSKAVNNPSASTKILPSFANTKKTGNYNFTANSDALKENLTFFSKDSDKELRDISILLLKELPRYRTLIAKVPELGTNKQLDFIMNVHFGGEDDPANIVKEVLNSNMLVTRILNQNKYDTVAVEDFYLMDPDFATLPERISERSKLVGKYISPAEAKAVVDAKRYVRAYWQYMADNPTKEIFGFEELLLAKFMEYSLVTTMIESDDPRVTKFKKTISLVMKLRSELAFARTVEKMAVAGHSRGVIVMGYVHIHEFRPMVEAIGMESQFYVTISAEALKQIRLEF